MQVATSVNKLLSALTDLVSSGERALNTVVKALMSEQLSPKVPALEDSAWEVCGWVDTTLFDTPIMLYLCLQKPDGFLVVFAMSRNQ